MKLKEIFYGLGLRPPAREYQFEIRQYPLDGVGTVDYAQWLHPAAVRWNAGPDATELAGVRRWVRPGDVVLDVGAHAGDSTLPLALAAGPTGLVLAFEPNPYAFRVLAANAGLNPRLTNVHPYMFAATESDERMTFEYSDPGYCNGGRHEGVGRWRHAHFFPLEVQGRNVARFLEADYPQVLDRVRYVKIDAEGYDHVVFRSLRPVVERSRPVIRTEIFKHMPHDARTAYLADLTGLGYEVRRMRDDRDYEGEPITVADAGRWTHYDVLAVPIG